MADGTPKISPFSNKKGAKDIVKPYDMTRKYVNTEGPYEQQLTMGVNYYGADALADILLKLFKSLDSLNNFQEGKVLKNKTGDLGLQLKTINNQPCGIVVKVK